MHSQINKERKPPYYIRVLLRQLLLWKTREPPSYLQENLHLIGHLSSIDPELDTRFNITTNLSKKKASPSYKPFKKKIDNIMWREVFRIHHLWTMCIREPVLWNWTQHTSHASRKHRSWLMRSEITSEVMDNCTYRT